MTHFSGDLRISIDHGDQHLEVTSPGSEGNPMITDDFGGVWGAIKSAGSATFKAVTGGGSSAAKASGKAVSFVVKESSKPVSDVASFTTNAAKAAGHGAHSLAKATIKATGEITDLADKIPYVGKPFSTAIGVFGEPLRFAEAVASGKRIDRAAYDSVKRSIKAAKTLAPYAQMVAAAIPGLGTGVAAGIAGGLALAEGRTINEAAVAAARAAIPGGPAAQIAFDAAVAAGKGQSAEQIAKTAAMSQLPPAERAAAEAALEVASAAAEGKPVDEALLRVASSALDKEGQKIALSHLGKTEAASNIYDELTRKLPPSVKNAMVSGVAMGVGEKIQREVRQGVTTPEMVNDLARLGNEVTSKSEILKEARSKIPDVRAFDVGIGLMRYGKTPSIAVSSLRTSFSKPAAKVSFDAALATHIGAVTSIRLPKKNASYKVGYYGAVGLLQGAKSQRAGVLKLLTKKNPGTLHGVAAAVSKVKSDRVWWKRMVAWLKEIW